MEKALLNLSGHALAEDAKEIFDRQFDYVDTLPPIEVDFSANVERQIRNYIRLTKVPLDGSVSVTIVPPGHPTFSIMIFMFLNGVLGDFPGIYLMERDSNASYMPSNLFDGHSIRKSGRAFRQETWRNKYAE